MSQTARSHASTHSHVPPTQPHTARVRASRTTFSHADEQKDGGDPAAPDYTSHGASVEETRAERYTPDYVRSLTPRSRRALAQEGILPEELVYRPLSAFDGAALVANTTGIVAAVGGAAGDQSQPAEDPAARAAAEQVQHLRWKDWEASRAVALLRARTTRRRNISGLRHTLFGIGAKTAEGGALPLPEPVELSLAHAAARTNGHHLPPMAHSRSFASNASSTAPHPSASSKRIPPHQQLHESPLFASHPLHDRYKSSTHPHAASLDPLSSGAPGPLSPRVAQRLQQELGADASGAGASGGLSAPAYGRMRERILREEERAEWERNEAKQEERERRRREQRENEWYLQRRAALQAAHAAAAAAAASAGPPGSRTRARSLSPSQSARAAHGRRGKGDKSAVGEAPTPAAASAAASASASGASKLSSTELAGPRTTRAELLRTGGGVVTSTGALQQQQQPAVPGAGAPGTGTGIGTGAGDTRPSMSRRATVMPSSAAAAAAVSASSIPLQQSHSHHASTSSLLHRFQGPHHPAPPPPPPPPLASSASFADRIQHSVEGAAAKYAAMFESAAAKIVARQEADIAALARAEEVRLDAARKEVEIQRRRAEGHRLERVRRAAENEAAQASREAKFARVEAEEMARTKRVEQELQERMQRTSQVRQEHQAERAARVEQQRKDAVALDAARRVRMEDSQRAKAERLEIMVAEAEESFERSRARMEAEQARMRQEKERAHEKARGEAARAAAQKAQEACEAKMRAQERRAASLASRRGELGHTTASSSSSPPPPSALTFRGGGGSLIVHDAHRSSQRAEREAQRAILLAQGKQEVEERAQSLLAKAAADDARVRAAEAERQKQLLLDVERKRLEAARAQRNLDREARKAAFAAAARSEKLQADLARLEAIQGMKAAYAKQHAQFAKNTLMEVQQFKQTYEKLRTAGAIAKITREAKQRQKALEEAQDELDNA